MRTKLENTSDEVDRLRAEVERLRHSIITDERNPLRAEVERLTAEHREDVFSNLKMQDRITELEGALEKIASMDPLTPVARAVRIAEEQLIKGG